MSKTRTVLQFPARELLRQDHEYDANDYDVDVGHLYHVLEAAVETMDELDFGKGRTRNHTLDRLAALVHVGRDISERALEQRGCGVRS